MISMFRLFLWNGCSTLMNVNLSLLSVVCKILMWRLVSALRFVAVGFVEENNIPPLNYVLLLLGLAEEYSITPLYYVLLLLGLAEKYNIPPLYYVLLLGMAEGCNIPPLFILFVVVRIGRRIQYTATKLCVDVVSCRRIQYTAT